MKFLFIVQGEGRGHFTQAITLEDMLLRKWRFLSAKVRHVPCPAFSTGVSRHR